MLIAGFPAGPLAANCYVLAPDGGPGCVVVDPGQACGERLATVLGEFRLRPAAVLLTHGHFDHVASARRVCEEFGVPAYLHADDQYMLDDPLAALSPEFRAGIPALLQPGDDLRALRPAEVADLEPGAVLEIAGIAITVIHTPGHTGGSVVYRIDGDGDPRIGGDGVLGGGGVGDGDPGGGGVGDGNVGDAVVGDEDAGGGGVGDGDPGDGGPGNGRSAGVRPEVLLTGDTLFAGSIGRSDLPGGSSPLILSSIATRLLTRPGSALVLPGHGPTSTIGAERAGNPFLAGLG